MKKLVIAFFALLMTVNVFSQATGFNLFSQGITFENGTFTEALEKAKSENKLVFMDCYTTWCGPCKMLAKQVFTQKEVGDYFNPNFVNVKMDMEKGEGIDLAKKYEVRAYPTLLWLNGEGEVVHKMIGGGSPQKLIDVANTANNPEKNWAAVDTKYKAGEKSIEFLQTYLLTASQCGFDTKKAAEEYYSKRTTEELFNKTDMDIIAGTAKSTSNDKFKLVLENKEKFYAVADKAMVNQFLEQTMGMELGMAMRSGNPTTIENKKKELIELDETIGNKIIEGIEMQMLYRNPDKNKFFDAFADFTLKYESENSQALNQAAWMIVDAKEEVNKEILEKAAKMAKRSVELDANFANTDTYAYALYKLEQIDKAKEYAAKSVELAPENQKKDLWSLKLVNGEL